MAVRPSGVSLSTGLKIPVVIKAPHPAVSYQRLNSAPKNNLAVKLRKWMEKYSITNATKTDISNKKPC